jgi:hypothetical protein
VASLGPPSAFTGIGALRRGMDDQLNPTPTLGEHPLYAVNVTDVDLQRAELIG